MPNNKIVAPPSSLFEYVIRALSPRSKHAIDLSAYTIAKEKIACKRKEKRRKHLRLIYSNSEIE